MKADKSFVKNNSVIKDGRPMTFEESGEEDLKLMDDLSSGEQKVIREWIQRNIWPSSTYDSHSTSYGIKHIMEDDTGVYVTNNQFKDAMLQCGFVPVDERELNWRYRIDRYSPAFLNGEHRLSWDGIRREGPFKEFMRSRIRYSGPIGNVAFYSVTDLCFPWDGTGAEMREYVLKDGARGRFLRAFDRAWKKFSEVQSDPVGAV